MNPMIWHKVAAISGVAALGLGTYGSHGFRPKDETFKEVLLRTSLFGQFVQKLLGLDFPQLRLHVSFVLLFFSKVWRTASLYHLVHTAALVGAPVAKHPNIFGGLLTAGILAFSGSCYATAYLEDRQYSFLAPFGGFAFIGAWASLIF
ncbi:transmembrane protein 256 homolog isoform X1 [Zingiber officinale]|uniref:transmembrane protein 256 homolog isoform X1 n=1 Tax=Zingiber officinale TaxID=94328 RepID=UPI001C4CBF4C|nr:transmembrane protein 256 homolog isoform X1 [Zingiber officinale]